MTEVGGIFKNSTIHLDRYTWNDSFRIRIAGNKENRSFFASLSSLTLLGTPLWLVRGWDTGVGRGMQVEAEGVNNSRNKLHQTM